MSNSTRKWIRSGIEILIHGGVSALIAAVMSVKQTGGWFFMTAQFWQLVCAQFAGSGLIRFLQFLNNNPLPDETTPPIPGAAQISINPLSKVQPMPKQEG